MIRLVCFDWGNVILSTAADLAEAALRGGVPLRPGLLPEAPFRGDDDLGRRLQLGELDFDAFCREVARTCGGYAPEEIARIHHGWLRAEIEGVPALIEELQRGERVETALLSNTNAAHWERRRDFPTAAGLDHPWASHLLGALKPDPAAYRALEERTGHRGEQILFFDDAPENVQAAARLGWQAVHVDPTADVARQLRAALAGAGLLD